MSREQMEQTQQRAEASAVSSRPTSVLRARRLIDRLRWPIHDRGAGWRSLALPHPDALVCVAFLSLCVQLGRPLMALLPRTIKRRGLETQYSARRHDATFTRNAGVAGVAIDGASAS